MSEEAAWHDPTMTYYYHLAIPHRAEPALLAVRDSEGGWSLPSVAPQEHFFAMVGHLDRYVGKEMGLDVTVLCCAARRVEREIEKRWDLLMLMENHSPEWHPGEGQGWVAIADLDKLTFADPEQREVVSKWLQERAEGVVPPRRTPWAIEGWYSVASAWAAEQLAHSGITLLGPLEQVKQWSISSILRASTNRGDLYLKAVPAYFKQEPGIVRYLNERFPGDVPEPIASEVFPDQGWLLMEDFGSSNLSKAEPAAVDGALVLLARIQKECARDLDNLLKAGCPDRTLGALQTHLDELLADERAMSTLKPEEIEGLRVAAPRLKEMCRQLESFGVPASLVHGDFHRANVLERDGRYMIFDWTDGCIAHPFLDLATMLDNVFDNTIPEERASADAYLQEWVDYEPMDRLREAMALAKVLGALHQAISYWRIVGGSEEATRWEFEGGLTEWLRQVLALVPEA